MAGSESPSETFTEIRVFLNAKEDGSLKRGEPALFQVPSMKVLEEPTIFLREHYVRSGRRRSPNTWKTAAYALCSWFEFLSAAKSGPWHEATREELIEYRDTFLYAISPKTGKSYASGTVALRMSVICSFYEFSAWKGWYQGDLAEDTSKPNALAKDRLRSTTSLIPERRMAKTAIRPFSPGDLRRFLLAIGPRASDSESLDESSRDRLIADMGWVVGLRLSEILSLTVKQISAIDIANKSPVEEQRLQITGKGGYTRNVAVPNWLIMDAQIYIQAVRKHAEKIRQKRGRGTTPNLFIAGIRSTRAGAPVGSRRVQQIVETACRQSGNVISDTVHDLNTSETYSVVRPSHCVHDLRHTYAVFTYWAERSAGNAEPWKRIQAQLGHAKLQTTVDTYLQFVELFGERAGVTDIRTLLAI